MLLFGTSVSLYSMCVFRSYQIQKSFTNEWWLWLFINGLSLGFVSSVKWVGLFVVALVGLHTIEDLYRIFGNKRETIVIFRTY